MSQSREDQLQMKVNGLRELIRRINYESNLTFRKLQKENMELREQLQQMKLAYSVLDQNCERFQKAINYWRFMYEEEGNDGKEAEREGEGGKRGKIGKREDVERVGIV